MTQIKRRETITDATIIQESIDMHIFDDGRSERRDLRLRELDQEYRHQLTHLKRIVREARHSFMGFARSNINKEVS
ncbi:MAG TPA: hypothetical protein VNE40_01150 [Candidatus Dormibacteraeota bacterium]|nr:hypothetical protein [Candidatus Dormibacteraeota bacterium]